MFNYFRRNFFSIGLPVLLMTLIGFTIVRGLTFHIYETFVLDSAIIPTILGSVAMLAGLGLMVFLGASNIGSIYECISNDLPFSFSLYLDSGRKYAKSFVLASLVSIAAFIPITLLLIFPVAIFSGESAVDLGATVVFITVYPLWHALLCLRTVRQGEWWTLIKQNYFGFLCYGVACAIALRIPLAGSYISQALGLSFPVFLFSVHQFLKRDYAVTELITVDFSTPTKTFMREIPTLYNGIRRKVTEPAVSGGSGYNKHITKTRGSIMVEILKPMQTLQGRHTFVIEYQIDMGADKNKGFDNFRWAITSGIYSVENLDFTLEFPEAIDNKALEFRVGDSPAMIKKKVTGRQLTGEMLGQLDPGKELTISLDFPDGYFRGATKYTHPIVYWAGGLAPLLVAAGLYIIKRTRLRTNNLDQK